VPGVGGCLGCLSTAKEERCDCEIELNELGNGDLSADRVERKGRQVQAKKQNKSTAAKAIAMKGHLLNTVYLLP
jgi:hypothetical protein